MRTPFTIQAIVASALVLFGATASAQGISIVQGSDGTSGTIIDLGGGIRSYSDSHGNTGTILDLGGGFQSYQFTSPHGGVRSGTILTLPAPRASFNDPPASPSPVPVLPFTPNGPLLPREQVAPMIPFGSGSNYGMVGGYGTGRFRR